MHEPESDNYYVMPEGGGGGVIICYLGGGDSKIWTLLRVHHHFCKDMHYIPEFYSHFLS